MGIVKKHLACRISAFGAREKRVPWILRSVLGKIHCEFRRVTRRMRIICQLGFSALRESRKVTPGVFIFSVVSQIYSVYYQNLL